MATAAGGTHPTGMHSCGMHFLSICDLNTEMKIYSRSSGYRKWLSLMSIRLVKTLNQHLYV